MNTNDNWMNQNPSEKKQADISSIPEINSIPEYTWTRSTQAKTRFCCKTITTNQV
jgi:hypothetical protein